MSSIVSKPGFRVGGDGRVVPIVRMKCHHCGVLHATHEECPIDVEQPGRTLAEAVVAGDLYEIQTADGRHALCMPGCVGVYQAVAAARVHWKARLGQMVKIWRVLPGSGIGCMYVEKAGEVVL